MLLINNKVYLGNLTKIECAYNIKATQSAAFELIAVDSANQSTTAATWTIPANTKHFILSSINVSSLNSKTVYIRCTEGGANAYGFTATLMWQQ